MAQETKTPPVILLPMELLEDFELLNNEELGEIIKATFSYVDKKEKPKFKDRSLQFIFSKMKKICDDNFNRYQKICERNKQNAVKRWESKNQKNVENKGQNLDENATGYESIPLDTTGYQSVPVDANIKYKNKNIKYKNKNIKNKKENIKNKNNIKKEKVVKRKKANADGVATTTTTTDFSSCFHFDDIVEIGKKFGINADYCKKFYAYYESNNWETMKGEKIVNVERLLKKWYDEDKKNKKAVGFISNDEEAIENDTKRIFENI